MSHAQDVPGGLGRRRRAVVAVLVVAMLAAGTGWYASGLVRSPAQVAAAAAAPPPSVITASVEHRVLRSQVITRGQVVTSRTLRVSPQGLAGEGTPVVTAVRVRVGDRVRPGDLLMSVSGRPVFALRGKVPAYRDLRPGDSGNDVAQLQKALTDLGYATGGDSRGRFGSGTKAAVQRFYAHLGFRPQPATPDDEATLQSGRDAVTTAERALVAQREAVGDARRELGVAEDAASRRAARRVLRDALRQQGYARQDLGRARQDLAAAYATTGPMVVRDEVVFLPTPRGRVQKVAAAVGAPAAEGAMVIATGDLLVVAALDPLDEPLVRTGQRVELYSEVRDRSVTGTVTAVTGTPPGGAGGSGAGGAGRYAVITPKRALPADFAEQDLRVTITAGASDGRVLVVPVSALSSGADGRTTVSVLEPDGQQRSVAVVSLVDAGGFVGVRPERADALAAGAQVVVGVRDQGTGTQEPGGQGTGDQGAPGQEPAADTDGDSDVPNGIPLP